MQQTQVRLETQFEVGKMENAEDFAFTPSLRQYELDQVQRVTARQFLSPLTGLPLVNAQNGF